MHHLFHDIYFLYHVLLTDRMQISLTRAEWCQSRQSFACYSIGPQCLHVQTAYVDGHIVSILLIFSISENRKVLNNVEYFDFNEKKWRVIAPMIIPRKLAGSAILDGQLYAVGGINREYADLVTVESYNPCVGQWTSVTSLNKCKGIHPI